MTSEFGSPGTAHQWRWTNLVAALSLVLVALSAAAAAASAATQLAPPFDPSGPTFIDRNCGVYSSTYLRPDAGDCDTVPPTAKAKVSADADQGTGTAAAGVEFASPGYGLGPAPPEHWMGSDASAGVIYHLTEPAQRLNFTVTLRATGTATPGNAWTNSGTQETVEESSWVLSPFDRLTGWSTSSNAPLILRGFMDSYMHTVDTPTAIFASADATVWHTGCRRSCYGGAVQSLRSLTSAKSGETATEPGKDVTLHLSLTNCVPNDFGGCTRQPIPPGDVVVSGGTGASLLIDGVPAKTTVRVEAEVTGIYLDSIEH